MCVCVERHIAEKWYFSYSIIDHSRVTALCVHLMQIFFFTVAHFVFTFELCAAVFFKMALDYGPTIYRYIRSTYDRVIKKNKKKKLITPYKKHSVSMLPLQMLPCCQFVYYFSFSPHFTFCVFSIMSCTINL